MVRAAATALQEAARQRRRAIRRRTRLPEHGTRRRYQVGCQCLRCRVANAAYAAATRRRTEPSLWMRIDATPARKRLRQLKAEGFTDALIAQELGVKQFNLRGRTVTIATHLKLEDLYQRRVADGTPVTNFSTASRNGVDFDDCPPIEPVDNDPRCTGEQFVPEDREEEAERRRSRDVTTGAAVIESRAR